MKNVCLISKKSKPNISFVKSGLNIVIGLLIILILGFIILYFLQDELIFAQQQISKDTLNYIKRTDKNIEEINLKVKDGTNLHGWFVKNGGSKKSKLLLYFGGNAEEVSYICHEVKRYEAGNGKYKYFCVFT